MSVKQMAKVWQHDFPSNQQSIMLAYADHADELGENMFPSIALIAWKTGYSPRQVTRIVNELKDAGIMIETAPSGFHQPITYKFDWSKAKPKKPFISKGDKLSSNIDKRMTKIHKKDDISNDKDDKAMSPEPSFKSFNHSFREYIIETEKYNHELMKKWENFLRSSNLLSSNYDKSAVPKIYKNDQLALLVPDEFMADWFMGRINAPGILNGIRIAFDNINLEIKLEVFNEKSI